MPKQFHANPRTITGKQYDDLKSWLEEFGDLSGIVHDLNSDEIIGGNQRSRVMGISEKDLLSLVQNGRVVLTEQFDEPTRTGTIALGYVIWNGERYNYRQVKWTPEQCDRANIIANNAGGSWDWDMLSSFNPDLLEGAGFDHDKLLEFSNDYRALNDLIWSQKPAAEGFASGEQFHDNFVISIPLTIEQYNDKDFITKALEDIAALGLKGTLRKS